MPAHQPQADETSTSSALSAPSRRNVLLGMAAAGVAVVGGVAACSSDDDSSGAPGNGATTDGSTTSQPPTSPEESPSPTESDSPTATEEAPEGIASTADIPVGGGQIFEDQRVVITQPAAGEFKAFSAVCTHMGCTVGSVRDGLISCPCHGSQFNVADGSVARGPASGALPERQITIQDGSIILT